MYDMLKAKVDRLAGKTYLVPKDTKKQPFLGEKNLHRLTLGELGGFTKYRASYTIPIHMPKTNSLMIVLILTQPPFAQLSPLAGVLSNLLFFKSLLGTIFLS